MIKKVTLLVSGGIAAYKMSEVVSSLTKDNVDVTCVLTKAAEEFVPILVLNTLSRNKVFVDSDYFNVNDDPDKVVHISLAQDTDLVVLAPATANTLAKYRYGIADNLVTSILLATNKPVVIFPAMNEVMYNKKITQDNITSLLRDGVDIIRPDSGSLACGIEGIGRLPEPYAIIEYIKHKLYDKKDLLNKKVLINAGGTSEGIDKARSITNYSSGKMGIALAKEAFYRGADVTLVIAKSEPFQYPYIDVINVKTTKEMYDAMKKGYDDANVVVFSAAVSDFIPEKAVNDKIKKSNKISLDLKKNIDIAIEFSKIKNNDKIHIGFCAETGDLKEKAIEKLTNKKFDFIFANDISGNQTGFGSDNNAGLIINSKKSILEIPIRSKTEIAKIIFNEISKTII